MILKNLLDFIDWDQVLPLKDEKISWNKTRKALII